jgi:hypothetical protein
MGCSEALGGGGEGQKLRFRSGRADGGLDPHQRGLSLGQGARLVEEA